MDAFLGLHRLQLDYVSYAVIVGLIGMVVGSGLAILLSKAGVSMAVAGIVMMFIGMMPAVILLLLAEGAKAEARMACPEVFEQIAGGEVEWLSDETKGILGRYCGQEALYAAAEKPDSRLTLDRRGR